MNSQEKAAHYFSLAEDWKKLADDESGKTRGNGWSSWEVYSAERRQLYCLEKRDACLAKARELSRSKL